MTHQEITELLHKEIVPVTGCTGPTAYALAAAACRPYVTGRIRSYKVFVSPAYLKMGFGVATPGTERTGIAIATAACDMEGQDGDIMRKTMPFAIFWILMNGLMVYLGLTL